MHNLTIVFGGGSVVVWTLMFKEAEKAQAAYDQINRTGGQIVDDFGQTVCVKLENIHGVMLEDTALSQLAHVERAIHHAHIQSDVQTRAQTDAKLRFRGAMNGPAMLSPMNGMNG